MTRHIAIIGGGYSGTLQAIQLLARGIGVTLITRGEVARGVAYGTKRAEHLLNVRAAGMSAYPDRPSHFADWLSARGSGDASTFAARRIYGTYLEEQLASARAEHGAKFSLVEGEAVDVAPADGGEAVLLADGKRIEADAAILSVGNLPADIPGIVKKANLPEGIVTNDPWAEDLAAGLDANDAVLLIGTGLTAIDAALTLEASGFKGRILALSRRGLLPRRHAEPAAIPQAPNGLEPDALSLLRTIRAVSGEAWRGAVDSLRPHTQGLWAAASPGQRRRFLRHLRPWWDVHRHRIAPAIAERLDALQSEGRLDVVAGRIIEVEKAEEKALVRWRPRGSEQEESLVAGRIVICTGPRSDIATADDPLLRNLISAGRIRPDGCRIGIDVDPACRTLAASGETNSRLYAIGPMTKGAWWEIVAVPDLRVQVRALAEQLSGRA
jgi:uncharacterized NAD(P)/FAD-binding protein YdhS